jgi:hypothetical protein
MMDFDSYISPGGSQGLRPPPPNPNNPALNVKFALGFQAVGYGR